MSLEIGQTLGDYQVVAILGAGGMGKVYKVRNVISDRVEAMKVLLPNLESDPELGERFLREIKVQASLDHPNIAGLHTAQRVDNQLLMIMEFIEGESLESVLRKGPLPLAKGIDYVMQVLSALAFAHSRGVIHRDIKPANMMITTDGVVKLMDFGIAKMAADRRLTQTGRTVGSLYYMSPEQIQGAIDLDPRADIYSLGVSLYEMVTGKRPFEGDSDYSIMAAHLQRTPVPPIQIDPAVPPELNEIILMAIAKDPAARFQTAEAFRAALESVLGMAAAIETGATAPFANTVPPQPPAKSIATDYMQQAPAPPAYAPPPAVPQAPPPQAAQASPPYAAIPQAPPPVASAPRSRRGLYMALGSLLTVGVIVLAAFQLPKFLGTSAQEAEPAAVEAQPPLQQAAEPVTMPPADPAAASTQDSAPPASIEPPAQPAVRTQSAIPASGQPSRQQAGKFPDTGITAPAKSQPAASPASTYSAPAASPAPAPPVSAPQSAQQSVPQSAPAIDPARRAEIAQLRERMMMMAVRVNAARTSLNRLQQQQASSGLGMRGDATAANQRMAFLMDEAEAALSAGDPAAAKKNLDGAERQLETLERILGL